MKLVRKYLKYCFLFAISLIVAGIVARLFATTWSWQSTTLILVGSVLFLVCLSAVDNQQFWQKRSTQANTNVLVATTAFITILSLVNFIAVRSSLQLDLTENQLFTLAPQTQAIVKNLDLPVKIWFFERRLSNENKKLLNNYSRYNSQFTYELVDPEINISLARQFNVQSLGEVYLEYGEKKQLVDTLRFGESLNEVQLTNSLQKIQRDRSEVVYFLQGHGEPPLDISEGGMFQAVNGLKEQGYVVLPLNLTQLSTVPSDANVVIITEPKRKLFAGEVTALKRYLDAGGSLMIMLTPNIETGLESILKGWGIKLDNRLIIDDSGKGSVIGLGPATPLVIDYGEHPITRDFNNNISVYPMARPLDFTEIDRVETTPIIITNDRTWGESDLASEQLTFNPQKDIQGPLNLGLALVRNSQAQTNNDEASEQLLELDDEPKQQPETEEKTENKQPESRIVLIGNGAFATNGWFEQQLNGDVFLNSVNWLVNSDRPTLSIRPKTQQNRRLNLSLIQAALLGWLALLIIPLSALISAGIVWWRRR